MEEGGTLIISASNQLTIGGTIVVVTGGTVVLESPLIHISAGASIVAGDLGGAGAPAAAPPDGEVAISAGTWINIHGTLTTGTVEDYADVAAAIAGLPAGAAGGVVNLSAETLIVDGSMGVGVGSEITVTDTATINGTLTLTGAVADIDTLELQGATLLLRTSSS